MSNQYSPDSPHNEVRRENLRLYLEEMAVRSPKILLVGEAPGYRGCRLSGIPFTSEAMMLEGVPAHGVLGKARGYQKTSEWPQPAREQTATIVWETLASLPHLPLFFWNVVPFHPHKPGNPWSNRRPRAAEIEQGISFLLELVKIFGIQHIVAVGKTADCELGRRGIPNYKVRHPARGGKREFVAGLKNASPTSWALDRARGKPIRGRTRQIKVTDLDGCSELLTEVQKYRNRQIAAQIFR